MFADSVNELDRYLSSSLIPDASFGAGVEAKRRRREIPRGNPEKAKCIKCGRIPHRRCEHNLCPRCCNVVIRNCPVHKRKSETRRGASLKQMDNSRNGVESDEVYKNELESLRRRYRWLYELKRESDEQQLQQSINRYKENANWLSEVFNSDCLDHISDSTQDHSVPHPQGQDLLDRCEDFLNRDLTLPDDSTSRTPEISSKKHRGRKKGRKGVTSHSWVTPVIIPESESQLLWQITSSKVPQHL